MTLNDVFMTIKIGYDEEESFAAEIQCTTDAVRVFPALHEVSLNLTQSLLLSLVSDLYGRRRDMIDFDLVRPGDLK